MKIENDQLIKNQKGITLVALIITVIVLLILATVSISLVINSGIISKAEYATDLYAIEQLKEQLYLKSIENKEDSVTGKLSDLNLNINQDLINKYDDILYAKDGKLYLSFIAAFPDTDLYKNNKGKIETLKNNLEINYESIKSYNKVVNSSFNDGLNGWYINNESNNIVEIINENENNHIHIDMKYKEGGYTTYVSQTINEISSQDNDKIYINIKYRNKYAASQDNLKINNLIISLSRSGGGYDETILTPNQYISNYNKGWINTSKIRLVSPSQGLLLRLGGDAAFASSWEYTIDFDDVYAINLTEIFGAGNEPTKEQMDEIFNKF